MAINNILLTGEIKVGKSTIINSVIEHYYYDKKVSGFKTLPLYEEDIVKGYYIEDQLEKDSKKDKENIVGVLSEQNKGCIGIVKTFENRGVEILQNALKSNTDLILLDELGFFESKAEKFKQTVIEVIESENRVIGVLKKKDTEFLNSIKERDDVWVIDVDIENRNDIEEQIKKYWEL